MSEHSQEHPVVDSSVEEESAGALPSPALHKPASNIPSLLVAFLASLTTGATTYAFGLYGGALKKELGLSQAQLDAISTAFFVAGLASWIPGMGVDRWGPRTSLSTGGWMGCAALLLYYGVATQTIVVPRPLLVTFLSGIGVLIFLSSAMVTGSVFKLIVSTCGPGTKGSAVGVAKGYVGLGSGLYAALFRSLPVHSDLDFLPMAALLAALCAGLPARILLPVEAPAVTVDETTPRHFRILYASLGGMASVIIATSLSALHHTQLRHANYPLFLLLLLLWWGPLVALWYLPRNDRIGVSEDGPVQRIEDDEVLTSEELDAQHNDEEEEQGLLTSIETEDEPRQEYTLLQMLQTPSALLLIWTTTILVGGGTVVTNNMAQMVESLGFQEQVGPACLALFSVAQSGARVATGALSEAALNWNVRGCCIERGVPRPFFYVAASLVAVLAHVILGIAVHEMAFVLGSTLAGMAFGMAWPLMVLMIGEVFGTAHVAANYMFFDGFSSAAGTVFLSMMVAGDLYEDHIDPNSDDPLTCMGAACFRTSHLIVAILSLTCIVTSAGMMYTSRHVYSSQQLHTH